jgi:hypothetical protein
MTFDTPAIDHLSSNWPPRAQIEKAQQIFFFLSNENM